MPANSMVRRAAKRLLVPVLNDRAYGYLQALSMARDLRFGAFTEPEIELVSRIVKRGHTAVDVGANYGMWALPLSRAVGPSGRVWCFEPVPQTVSTLRLVVRILGLRNVEVVAKGCSDRAGPAVFDVPLQDNGAPSAGQAHAAGRQDDRPGRERHARWPTSSLVEVDLVRIDDVLDEAADVALLKVDVEGAELAALRGARGVLERCAPTIVCEINPWYLEGFRIAVEDLVSFLGELGYALYRYAGGGLIPVDTTSVDEDNYVCVHPRRLEPLATLITEIP